MAPIRLAQLLLDAAKNAPQNGVTYYSPAQEVCDTITYPDLLQAAQDLSRRIVKHLSCSGAPRRRIVLLYSDSQVCWLKNHGLSDARSPGVCPRSSTKPGG